MATLGVGVGALAGCDLDPDGSAPQPSAGADPDSGLVDTVLAELRALSVLVSGVGAAHPGLQRTMTGLRELHVAHREALGDEPAEEPAGDAHLDPRTGAAQALDLVRSRERRAQGRLADWSVAAQSGALARLLACMSAGVAQHLAALPAGAGAEA